LQSSTRRTSKKIYRITLLRCTCSKGKCTVKLYTKDEDLLIAAILHDVPEDCYDNIWDGYAEIKRIFGKRVADLVMELTSNEDEMKHRYDGNKKDYLVYKLCLMMHLSLNYLID
jgi:(p)ppGpp synthase/HD superfamily hydrolase